MPKSTRRSHTTTQPEKSYIKWFFVVIVFTSVLSVLLGIAQAYVYKSQITAQHVLIAK